MSELTKKTCKPCEGGSLPLEKSEIEKLLRETPDWKTDPSGTKEIYRSFEFKNYYQTIAFVNAVAWLSHREDHHPDLEVSYKQCRVKYSTHAINGLSDNDFICAAKIDILIS